MTALETFNDESTELQEDHSLFWETFDFESPGYPSNDNTIQQASDTNSPNENAESQEVLQMLADFKIYPEKPGKSTLYGGEADPATEPQSESAHDAELPRQGSSEPDRTSESLQIKAPRSSAIAEPDSEGPEIPGISEEAWENIRLQIPGAHAESTSTEQKPPRPATERVNELTNRAEPARFEGSKREAQGDTESPDEDREHETRTQEEDSPESSERESDNECNDLEIPPIESLLESMAQSTTGV